MLNDFVDTLEYMDRIVDQRYVYKALEGLEVILNFLKRNDNEQTQKIVRVCLIKIFTIFM